MRSPAWIRFVLSTLAPRGRTHEAIGDLEEVHRRRLEAGASRPAAWCASSLEGLGVAAALVACRLIDREPWSALLNATEWRLAARRSLRQPLMSLVTIFALAVGIALAVTAFSALEATLFAEVPFEAGDRFVRLRLLEERTGAGQLDLDRYRALEGERDVFEHVGAAGFDLVNLRYESGEIESITASLLTPETFSYLPYAPILGRPFSADDGAPGAPPVALIRESLWHRRFGGERTALGRTLQINGAAHTLVGVLPDEATFPARSEVWIPLGARFVGGNVHGPHPAAQAFAVLAAGVSTPQAQERVDLISRRVAEERGETRETRVELNSFTQMPPGALPGLSILVTVLVMLLMVVASNISNLNLVRISARSSELAMRAALGASRPLLIGQILGEILLLCALAVTAFSALEATLFAEVPFEAGDRFVLLRLLEERTGAGQLDLDRYRA
ncbi:MAG: ABC transporter permease, partial [Acidobacteriota bacterium]